MSLKTHRHLRLLSASGCLNVTAQAFSSLLWKVPFLYYLDLSNTKFLKKRAFLEIVGNSTFLRYLRILKLRNVGLDDADMVLLCIGSKGTSTGVANHVWSLDVRDNLLTDATAILLKEYNSHTRIPPAYLELAPPPYQSSSTTIEPDSPTQNSATWDDLFALRMIARQTAASFPLEDKEATVVDRVSDAAFTSSLQPSSQTEGSGLAHLYMSGNRLTHSSLAALPKLATLRSIDIGTIARNPQRKDVATYALYCREVLSYARFSKYLWECPNLSYLRINHKVVTGFCSAFDDRDGLAGFQLDSEELRVELEQLANSGRPCRGEASSVLSRGFICPSDTQYGSQWSSGTPRAGPGQCAFVAALLTIQTLVLTDVPIHSRRGRVSRCLEDFLRACGEMEHESVEHQRRTGFGAHSQAHKETSLATDHVVLEMEWKHDFRAEEQSVLSYGQEDMFAESSKGDFSFFPGENSSATSVPLASAAAPRSASKTLPDASASKQAPETPHPKVDVVATLVAFRKAQRERRAAAESSAGPPVDPFWSGRLQVVR
ncbi:hypothetical protein LTR16_000070 [Cryomyces antarcticus]|uniref:Uncharacterized protein n=1 Tax=Cryomyces antarcticus TaxID=329879 RepID=A0ABR0M950_9PEZI|nr:hypothetical protein LTR16_000070 [Cryomyces antarcticus]